MVSSIACLLETECGNNEERTNKHCCDPCGGFDAAHCVSLGSSLRRLLDWPRNRQATIY